MPFHADGVVSKQAYVRRARAELRRVPKRRQRRLALSLLPSSYKCVLCIYYLYMCVSLRGGLCWYFIGSPQDGFGGLG